MASYAVLTRALTRYRSSQESIWALATQIVASGANFLTSVLLVRSIGLTEFGRFSICFLLVIIVRNFQVAALLTPMSTVGPKLSPCRQPAYRAFILANALAFGIGASLVLLLGSLLTGKLLTLGWLTALAPALAFANFTGFMAEFYRRHCFNRRNKFAAMIVEVTRYTIQVAVILILVYLMPAWLSAFSALLALAFGGMVASIYGALHFGSKRWNRLLALTFWSRHWRLVKWLTPSVIFTTINGPGCIFFASFFFNEAMVGGLRAMQSISNILQTPINGMQNVAVTAASKKMHNHGANALRAYLIELLVGMGGISAIILVAVVVFREEIIFVTMGIRDASFSTLLVLFCAANVVLTINWISSVGLQAMERGRPITVGTAVGAFISLMLIVVLVPAAGIDAVPIARIFSLALSSLLLFFAIRTQITPSGRASMTGDQTQELHK